MKRVLLTGGTGFVGANMARRLLRDGHEVHLLVRPEHAAWRIEEIRRHVRLHLLDLSDAQAVSKAVEEIKRAHLRFFNGGSLMSSAEAGQ